MGKYCEKSRKEICIHYNLSYIGKRVKYLERQFGYLGGEIQCMKMFFYLL